VPRYDANVGIEALERERSDVVAERALQHFHTWTGDRQGTTSIFSNEPILLETESGDLRTDMACKMRPPLTPIEAWAAENTSAFYRCREADTKIDEKLASGLGHFAGISLEDDMAAFDECVRYANTK